MHHVQYAEKNFFEIRGKQKKKDVFYFTYLEIREVLNPKEMRMRNKLPYLQKMKVQVRVPYL